MTGVTISSIKRAVQKALLTLAGTVVFLGLVLTMMWRDRDTLEDVPLAAAPQPDTQATGVTVTWFGVATLLFDDGETQILIDGFISRPTFFDVLLRRAVSNDVATINRFLNEYRVRRLAAIIPVHSHFDHAMDIGAIANRSSASILGSASTAQIAYGSGVPEDQVIVVADGAEFTFGEFTVRFIESDHGPIGWRGSVPLAGTIDEPLTLPAPVTAWREGGSYSIVVSHPLGTTLVQGSAGMRETSLQDLQVDTVMLGVGMLSGLGRDYIEDYWRATVTSTGAGTVIPVHFDDYTQPFGLIRLAPTFIDDFLKTLQWLDEFRNTWDAETDIFMPAFGTPIQLYERREAET